MLILVSVLLVEINIIVSVRFRHVLFEGLIPLGLNSVSRTPPGGTPPDRVEVIMEPVGSALPQAGDQRDPNIMTHLPPVTDQIVIGN